MIPGELAAVSGARRRVDGWLEGWGASAAVRQDAALVVSELCTNAVEAAPRHRIGVHVRFDGDGDQILLAVENPGSIDAIPDPGAWRPTSPSATGGRGLMIVAALADRVEVEARRGESERVMVRAVLPAHSRR